MRYWWVNQNQPYRHEIEGGYLWSPKRSANGARNPFYESMREVAPGDLIFSFMDARILAVGIARQPCGESPNPLSCPTIEGSHRKRRSALSSSSCELSRVAVADGKIGQSV